jgi:hypothetical protein
MGSRQGKASTCPENIGPAKFPNQESLLVKLKIHLPTEVSRNISDALKSRGLKYDLSWSHTYLQDL